MTSFEHVLSFSGECFLAGASSHLLLPTIHPYPVSTVTQDKPGLEPAQKVRERIHCLLYLKVFFCHEPVHVFVFFDRVRARQRGRDTAFER